MKLSWTEIGYWEGAHWQNTLSQCSDARQCPHISSIAQAPHTIPGKGRYRRCLHLGHLSQLASLDEATLSAADSSADADQPNGGESVSPPSASAKPAGPYSSGFELEVLNSEDSPVIGEGWSDRGPSRAALRDSRRWRATLRSPYLASLQLGTGFPRPIQRIPGGVSFDYSLTAGARPSSHSSGTLHELDLHLVSVQLSAYHAIFSYSQTVYLLTSRFL